MRVVVTGGAGFIGANLVRELMARQQVRDIVVVDDLSTGHERNLDGLDVRLMKGTITDRGLVEKAFRGADSVVHLAARTSVPRSVADPVAFHDVNATGTISVLEAARKEGVGHIVAASSSSVYGGNPILPKSEDLAPLPVSPYAASKLASEAYLLAYGHSYGVGILPFRFFNVFGPLQSAKHAYAAVLPRWIEAALAGRSLIVHGDGEQTRDFTFVHSVVLVIADAVVRQVTSEQPVNLAFGSRRTLVDVLETMEQLLQSPLRIVHSPPRVGDVRHSQADSTRLRALFPNVKQVAFEEGLRETIEWFSRSGASG